MSIRFKIIAAFVGSIAFFARNLYDLNNYLPSSTPEVIILFVGTLLSILFFGIGLSLLHEHRKQC